MDLMNFLMTRSSTVLQIVAMHVFLLLPANSIANNRYWVAATTSNWNNTANWSNNTGGPGGYSVPDISDNAVFNADGLGNCNVDITVNIDRVGINGYTGTIDLGSNTMTISASTSAIIFSSGTLNGSAQLSITTTGTITFSGTTFGAPVNISADDFKFDASTFNATSSFTKTGGNTPLFDGGCTFNGITTITNSGATDLYISALDTDIFNNDVTFTSNNAKIYVAPGFDGAEFNGNVYVESSSSNVEIGDPDPSAGVSTLASGKVIAVGGGGFTSGELRIANLAQTGTTPQEITTPTGTKVYINNGCTWNGNITVTAPEIYVNGSTFEGSASFTKNNNAANSYSNGGNTFNGPVTIENANSDGNLTLSAASPNLFNDDVTFKTSGTGTGIIYVAVWPGTEINGNLTINSPTGHVQVPPGVSIIMKGTADQSINTVGGTPNPIIYNLEIDNPAGDFILNSPMTVASSLVLTQGNIISTSTNLLTLNDNVTVTGASDASFVQGPVKKIGNDAFTFPVGDAGNYQPIAISAPSVITDAFTAEYIRADPGVTYDPDSKDAGIDHFSDAEYWTLDRTAGSSNVIVTLAWNGKSGGIDNLTDLMVARWDGGTWKDHGNGGTTGTASAGTIVTSAPVTDFSPFTLVSSTINNPLPIELLSFSAEVIEHKKVHLNWQTASETDNEFFTIERSINGVDWEVLEIIGDAGNSTAILSYSTLDKYPITGISYYRLKQTDYDGMFSYSETRVVKIDRLENNKVTIYPNPTKGLLTIEGDKNELKTVRIYNILGEDVTEQIAVIEMNETKKVLHLSKLKNGIYYCRTKTKSQKVVVK